MNVGSDQWKYVGCCDVCRRKTYCQTPCTAHIKIYPVFLQKMREQQEAERNKQTQKAEGDADG